MDHNLWWLEHGLSFIVVDVMSLWHCRVLFYDERGWCGKSSAGENEDGVIQQMLKVMAGANGLHLWNEESSKFAADVVEQGKSFLENHRVVQSDMDKQFVKAYKGGWMYTH